MATQEKYNATFPTRLRELLAPKGVTITALADKLEISRQAVSQYQDGSTQPNLQCLAEIAKYFGVSTDWLLGLTDMRTPNMDVRAIANYTHLSDKAIERLNSLTAIEGGDLYLIMLSTMIESPELYRLIGQIRYYIDRLAVYEASSKDDPAAFDEAEYKITSERYGVTYSFEKLLNDVLERLSDKYTNREASTSG